MAISPKQEEALAIEIRRIYEDAEFKLLAIIAKKFVDGEDVPEWANAKLALLSELLRDARRITGELDKRIPKEIEKIINLAYLSGNESALGDLKSALQTIQDDELDIPESIQMALFPSDPDVKFNIDATMATFTGINTSAVEALAGATTGALLSNHVPIVRAVEDIFREIVTSVAGSTLIGTETRREASQRILDKFANNGVKIFRDKAGRNWDLASYSEMATRASIGQASLTGHINKMEDMGFDEVQISDHAEECKLCRPWEGKVLSVSGTNPKRKSLSEARSAGLFHPNCGHRANTYFEGLTTPLKKTADPKGDAERQKQRYIERQIRQWKKRQVVAITPEAMQKANAKVSEWQTVMKEFIGDTGRRRKGEREQIKKGR